MIAAPTWVKRLVQWALLPPQAAITAQAPPASGPMTAPGQPKWQALPGQIIELGATGFQIIMDTSPHRPMYVLRAPEGWTLYSGADLPMMKQLGERFASERQEFVCLRQVMKW